MVSTFFVLCVYTSYIRGSICKLNKRKDELFSRRHRPCNERTTPYIVTRVADQLVLRGKIERRWFVIIPVYLPLFSLDLLERFENKEFKFRQGYSSRSCLDDCLMPCYDFVSSQKKKRRERKKKKQWIVNASSKVKDSIVRLKKNTNKHQ